jgi:alkaline phosphatase D
MKSIDEITRREFVRLATALGATAVLGRTSVFDGPVAWHERRDLFPEGVASGDPDHHSVILWTRRPYSDSRASARLRVEVALDEQFTHIVATGAAVVSAASDWTGRALVGGLAPATVYWYRFTDIDGNGSRVGRTITAPAVDDPRPVRFVFVSCQSVNDGAQNAYRRMIYEDERAPDADRIDFIIHLGDFIYEIVWYPEDRSTRYDRRVRDVVRYPTGEKIQDFHVPTSVGDYRAAYRGYLRDPDIQDARARWPFVNMWDNHEFSWLGWQSVQVFGGKNLPRQTRKLAANQAFFEFQPGRFVKSSGPSLERFDPPTVVDAPVDRFDEHGFGVDPNNVAAVGSLRGYRAFTWGKNVELIVTDQRSYRSEEPTVRPEARKLSSDDFPEFLPLEVLEILDAGKTYNNGQPPATIRVGDVEIDNFWKDHPAQTVLGAEQKAWFVERLRQSKATWKVWCNTTAPLEARADLQNLPAGLTKPWPGTGYAQSPFQDWSTAYLEKGEIYDLVRTHGITGFVTCAGDRHSFWAGLAATSLPPKPFTPVGVSFVTGSISAVGVIEAYEHVIPKDHPLHNLYVCQGPQDDRLQPTFNMLLRHGVRACLEYAKSGDVAKARALSNPDNAPHASFVDMGGHGYSVVRATSDFIETEFVCIPRPIERIEAPDGGPLRYRVAFRAEKWWEHGAEPTLVMRMLEGDAPFSY